MEVLTGAFDSCAVGMILEANHRAAIRSVANIDACAESLSTQDAEQDRTAAAVVVNAKGCYG